MIIVLVFFAKMILLMPARNRIILSEMTYEIKRSPSLLKPSLPSFVSSVIPLVLPPFTQGPFPAPFGSL
jgi:hypothetical protein